MRATTAKKLLSVVNTKKYMDALEDYMNDRKLAAYLVMEQATDPIDWHKAQGAIKELQRIKTLREEVIKAAEDKNG